MGGERTARWRDYGACRSRESGGAIFFFFFFLVGRKRDEVVTCTGETMKGEGNGTRQPGRRESDEWMT